MRGDKRGVFTLYEAALFFVFLMIASTIISAYSNYPGDDFNSRRNFSRYCDESRKALLGATVEETGYIGLTGQEVVRMDVSIRMLLLEQIYLEGIGVPRENFSYQHDIRLLANRHFRYNWILRASSDGVSDLIIGRNGLIHDVEAMRSRLSGTVTSSSWSDEGLEGTVEITLYLFE